MSDPIEIRFDVSGGRVWIHLGLSLVFFVACAMVLLLVYLPGGATEAQGGVSPALLIILAVALLGTGSMFLRHSLRNRRVAQTLVTVGVQGIVISLPDRERTVPPEDIEQIHHSGQEKENPLLPFRPKSTMIRYRWQENVCWAVFPGDEVFQAASCFLEAWTEQQTERIADRICKEGEVQFESLVETGDLSGNRALVLLGLFTVVAASFIVWLRGWGPQDLRAFWWLAGFLYLLGAAYLFMMYLEGRATVDFALTEVGIRTDQCTIPYSEIRDLMNMPDDYPERFQRVPIHRIVLTPAEGERQAIRLPMLQSEAIMKILERKLAQS